MRQVVSTRVIYTYQVVRRAFRSEMLWMSRQSSETILDNISSAFNNPPIAVGMSIAWPSPVQVPAELAMVDVSYQSVGLPSRTLARWVKFRRTMRDASSEPGCSRDQEQPGPDDDGADGSRDALTGRCETFDGDGCRHDSHRAQVHDPDDEEDRGQAGTAVAAVEAETHAVSPGRAGVRRQC